MTRTTELTAKDFDRALSHAQRARIMEGRITSGKDVSALRRFVALTQGDFARALGISIHTLRNWEQGRRKPEGPALALLRIAARHPKILHENLKKVSRAA
jgi:putative transcriptional regulator